jgi:hypothetical protein
MAIRATVTARPIRGSNMRALSSTFLMLLGFFVSSAAAAQALTPNSDDAPQGRELQKVPANVILVKGAWSSATDTVTPLPEGGKVSTETYDNPYFGLTLPVPKGWIQKYEGPPPSVSDRTITPCSYRRQFVEVAAFCHRRAVCRGEKIGNVGLQAGSSTCRAGRLLGKP